MGCPPVRKIIHSLKLVDYLNVQADNPWYNYYVYYFHIKDNTSSDKWVNQTNGVPFIEYLQNHYIISFSVLSLFGSDVSLKIQSM